MVWAGRIVVVALVYEPGGLRRGVHLHITPHYAPPQYVQVKAGTLNVIAKIPGGVLA